MYIKFKNDEIDKIFDRLMKYPVTRVKPITAQTLSRHKIIRRINNNRRNKLININNGIISLNPKIKIKKDGTGFDIKIY